MRSKILLLFVAAVTGVASGLVSAAFTVSPASAGHSWNGYHWSANNYPLNLDPINSLGPTFRDQGVATDVNADWNQSRKFANLQRFGDNDDGTRRNARTPPAARSGCATTTTARPAGPVWRRSS